MSPNIIEPESGLCNVAIVLIKDDFPAPFGPKRPNIPTPISILKLSIALTPFLYVFVRFLMTSFILKF